jgi:hypothetical protein
VANFDGGEITSDAGVLLLGRVESRRRIVERFASCFDDYREASRVDHDVHQIVGQRVFGLALGYEDVNDHDALRFEPLLATLLGKSDACGSERRRAAHRGAALAAPSTIHRLELSHPGVADGDRYRRIALDQGAADDLFVDLFIEAHEKAPKEIVLDLDATDDRVHGTQIGRHFHGHYDGYCFLPLYIFCGDHLLCARLRTADKDASAGSERELERIVTRIRAAWPKTRIFVRADSGFCRAPLLAWLESKGLDFAIGMARNARLEQLAAEGLEEARRRHVSSGDPERSFRDLSYKTRTSWKEKRRVVAKCEWTNGKANPRFVVTSLAASEIAAQELYEKLYCARGEMENRIKEQQLDLFADRTSCHVFRGNQVRLYMSSMAYVLMSELRRIGLRGSELARAQCGTIRMKLFKIGARVRVTVRRVWVSMSQSCPNRAVFEHAWRMLAPA